MSIYALIIGRILLPALGETLKEVCIQGTAKKCDHTRYQCPEARNGLAVAASNGHHGHLSRLDRPNQSVSMSGSTPFHLAQSHSQSAFVRFDGLQICTTRSCTCYLLRTDDADALRSLINRSAPAQFKLDVQQVWSVCNNGTIGFDDFILNV